MHVKKRDAASASADAKTKPARKADEADRPGHAATSNAVIDEPKVDWVPLAWAPFRYSPYGYIRSSKKWGENLSVKIRELATSISSRDGIPTPEFSIQLKDWQAWIKAAGIITGFNANGAQVYAFNGIRGGGYQHVTVSGDPDEFLNSKNWEKFSPQQKAIAGWHRSLVQKVVISLRHDFGEALNTGSAHIMARKNTVLAPFEPVGWDQWQYFKLDEPEPTSPSWKYQYYGSEHATSPSVRWFDPGNCGWGAQGYSPSTATGPNAERLYAIHVAPGVDRAESGELSPEEKCTHWLVESMTVFSERSPKTRGALIEEAVSIFPGLSERGFGRALFIARRQTGNFKWLTSGRRPKSRR